MSTALNIRHGAHLGPSILMVASATLIAALTLFFVSAVDVRAMLTPDAAAMRAQAPHQPVVMPREWIWRGRPPIDLQSMYGNRETPQPDYIVMHRAP